MDSSDQKQKCNNHKKAFENFLKTSKRKPSLNETDDGGVFANKFFTDFLNEINLKRFFRNTSLGAVFAERLNRTIRDHLERPVFEKRDSNWVDILLAITKQNNNRVLSSTKLTLIQAFPKKNKGYVYPNLLDKQKKLKPEFQINHLVRTADSKKTFSKTDTTNWCYIL